MEDVLNLYELPLNDNEPVICLDEKPVQLLQESRAPRLMTRPGQIRKRDYEYRRRGTANIYAVAEPKRGRHFNRVTPNRTGREFAKVMKVISGSYPLAKTIHVVMDNLNTHNKETLIRVYGEKAGKALGKRFMIHYTPRHGSWLNQAEIEVGLLSRWCLGKDRIADLAALRQRVAAWNRRANSQHMTVEWRFTTAKARQKWNYFDAEFMRSKH